MMQLRNQLEPNGNVMATVVSLEMSVLLLLSSLIFRSITYTEGENKFRSVSNNNNISMGLEKENGKRRLIYITAVPILKLQAKKISKSFLSRELKKHQMNYSGRCAKRFGLLLDTHTAENYTAEAGAGGAMSVLQESLVHIHKSS